jgi:hypothetical protein
LVLDLVMGPRLGQAWVVVREVLMELGMDEKWDCLLASLLVLALGWGTVQLWVLV